MSSDLVFGLNTKQQKAFNRLVKAYADCERLGIMFVNNYGQMEAYNKEYVKEYTDSMMINREDKADAISTHDHHAFNHFKSDVGWCDDEHLIVLTEKGKALFKEENEY